MTVRLLVNENFPAPSSAPRRAAGLEVMAVGECCPGINDERVLALALREQRWLVTFDRDYGDLIFRKALPPPPAVLLLRVPSYRPDEPAEWVRALVQDDRLPNRFSVFDGHTLRSRPFLFVT
jgi:predicted nuclease of predicted toxin-antitoxin system